MVETEVGHFRACDDCRGLFPTLNLIEIDKKDKLINKLICDGCLGIRNKKALLKRQRKERKNKIIEKVS